VGITFSELTKLLMLFSLLSGTLTIPRFGSIVQKGKFSAGMDDLVKALNRVDFPTLGKPRMPHLKPIFTHY
jgi:hypothetical protein